MKSYQQFFAELKRRNVFKVSAVYGAMAFALIQVAEPLGMALGLPDTFLTYIVGLLILGFPVALVLAWAFEVTPEGVQKTGAAAPGEIEAIVSLPASKRWPAGLMALAGVGALVLGAWWVGRQSAPAQTDSPAVAGDARLAGLPATDDGRPAIAVLPFADMSPEGDQEYFSDGITEEILNTLAKIRELKVSGRTSAFAYKGRNKDLRVIGRELDVGYLVEGSVRKAGEQLRITAQLVSAADGTHLWSEQYDRPMDDIFAVQTEIAEAIAAELRVPLGLEAGASLVTPTSDLTAYDLYLAGRTHMRQRGHWLVDAQRMFEAAIARDSTWAPAWAALAEVLEVRIWYPEALGAQGFDSVAIAAALEAAEPAARRALELDPRSASGFVALGSVQRDRAEWDAAEASYRRALELDPDLGEAYMQYAELLLLQGRIAEGVRAADRSAALDPAPVRFNNLGWALLMDDRPEEALAVLRLGAERDTQSGRQDMWGDVGDLYLAGGQVGAAIEAYGRVADAGLPLGYMDMDPDQAPPTREQIERYATGIADRDLARVPAEMRPALIPDQWMAIGHPDSAIAKSLWISATGPPGNVAWEIWMPSFDSLRDDPRIRSLLEAKGLGEARLVRTPPAERRRPAVLGVSQ